MQAELALKVKAWAEDAQFLFSHLPSMKLPSPSGGGKGDPEDSIGKVFPFKTMSEE